MKTTEQVIRYISLRRYSDEDWECLVRHIKSHYDATRVTKARRPRVDSTFEKFLDWEANGLGECDIIAASDGLLGMCHDTGSGYVMMASYHNQELSIKNSDLPVEWCRASEEQETAFKEKLREELYTYSQSLGVVYLIPEPPKGQMLKLSGKTTRYCIIKSIKNKTVTLWALLEEDKLVLNAKMYQGDIIAEPISKTEYKKFVDALENRSLYWNAEKKKLVSHILRVDRGEYYWYINEQFKIIESKDRRTKADNKRYENRNYFSDYKEALRLAKKINDFIKERY